MTASTATFCESCVVLLNVAEAKSVAVAFACCLTVSVKFPVPGLKRDDEFAYYAEQANKTALASAAMGKVVANHPGRTGGEPTK